MWFPSPAVPSQPPKIKEQGVLDGISQLAPPANEPMEMHDRKPPKNRDTDDPFRTGNATHLCAFEAEMGRGADSACVWVVICHAPAVIGGLFRGSRHEAQRWKQPRRPLKCTVRHFTRLQGFPARCRRACHRA